MLYGDRLRAMRLGVRWMPSLFVSDQKVGTTLPPLEAYSRIVTAPRVEGNNSNIGDCVETAGFNCVQTVLSRKGFMTPIPNSAVPPVYSAVTGWDPTVPSSDQGTNPEAFFSWWMKNPIMGLRLTSLGRLDPKNKTQIRNSIAISGGVFLIVALSTENQNERIWTANGTPGSWGDHAVWCDGFEADLTIGTSWGDEQAIRQDYFDKGFVLGAYAIGLTPGK